MACDEPIRPNYFYDLGITHTKKGKVTLYINGYNCSSDSPISLAGFPLEENNIQFLRSVSEGQASSGSVKRIQIWNKALSSDEMAAQSKCDLAEQTDRCESTVQFIPPYDNYKASSIAGYPMVNGVPKQTYLCSWENGGCHCPNGRVKYGANGKFITKDVDWYIVCNNNAFGSDPAPGVPKSCECTIGWGAYHYGQPRIGDTYAWRPATNTAGKEWLHARSW